MRMGLSQQMCTQISVVMDKKALDGAESVVYSKAVQIGDSMAAHTHTTYTHARAHLAELCDRAVEDREVVVIRRRGREPVALVAASELASLEETAHLLRSPANARRLLAALGRARERSVAPTNVEDLRRALGLEDR